MIDEFILWQLWTAKPCFEIIHGLLDSVDKVSEGQTVQIYSPVVVM